MIVEAEILSVGVSYSDVLLQDDDNCFEPCDLQANDGYHESSSCLEDGQQVQQCGYESESDEVTSALNVSV